MDSELIAPTLEKVKELVLDSVFSPDADYVQSRDVRVLRLVAGTGPAGLPAGQRTKVPSSPGGTRPGAQLHKSEAVGAAIVDTGVYAETECLHEFEVVILGAHRIAVFTAPVRHQIAA